MLCWMGRQRLTCRALRPERTGCCEIVKAVGKETSSEKWFPVIRTPAVLCNVLATRTGAKTKIMEIL